MKKAELLDLLYNERKRISDKYSDPGWNKWVLWGAAFTNTIYILDVLNKNTIGMLNNLIIIIISILVYIHIKELCSFYSKLKYEKHIIPITREKIFYFILTDITLAILFFTINERAAPLLIYNFKPSIIDIQLAVSYLALFTIINLLKNLRKLDLFSIDALIDETITSDNLNIEFTLKILQIIKSDSSLGIIFDKQIKAIIVSKSDLAHSINEYKLLKKDDHTIDNQIIKLNEISARTDKAIALLKKDGDSIKKMYDYSGNSDNIKYEQINKVAIDLLKLAKETQSEIANWNSKL